MTVRRIIINTKRVLPNAQWRFASTQWHAWIDTDTDMLGMGETESDAVHELYEKIAEAEIEQEERAQRSMERE